MPLNLALAGAGRAMQSLHAPALLQLGGKIRVCAVFDICRARADSVRAYFPEARIAEDFSELLCLPEVQAIAILTPPRTHAELGLRAIRAGKHVFLEKPLCTSRAEALDLADAARAAGVRAAVGHNLRSHRLVRRAAAAVRNKALGRLLQIETRWNSPGAGLPDWQCDRAQGGGVLFDLGVHHLDLARFLTSSEFVELSALTESEGSDDLRARVSGVLTGGVRFNALWSKGAPAIHTIRLTGSEAAIEFSMYSARSWKITPASAGRRLREAAEDFFHGLAGMRAGGDSAASYRAEWLDFIESVRTGRTPASSLEDAARNVAECEGLVASVRSRPRDAEQPTNRPALSVILGVHGSFSAVRKTVRHLAAQSVRDRIELVLVWASRDEPLAPAAEVRAFYSCAVEQIAPDSSVAAANAAGVRRASAPVVAFAEDHCFPEPGWAEALLTAHARGYAVVGPEIVNANPGNVVSWCDYLIGYGPWMSPTPAGEVSFLPGHNSSYKRHLLLEYGDALQAKLESETVLHYELAGQGHRLYIEPRARTAHLNFAQWKVWLPVQFHCGRVFAGSRASPWPVSRKLFYAAASPLIPAVRLLRIGRELLQPNRPGQILPRLLPALLLGLMCDGAGQMVGYITGPGRSPERLSTFEYNRVRYIRSADRIALEEADERAAG
jgi:predicted dehydrogenase